MVVRVFVAGGTEVIGRRLVPQLVARGHQVTATTTSAAKLGLLEQLGADGVVMDGLDAVSVGEAVAAARPDAIVNQMTALSVAHAGKPNLRKADRFFATTNRLRSEGTDHLLAAAEATGVSHVVAQNAATFNGIREGGWVKTEDDPLEVVEGTKAINHLEDVVVRAGGAVLRYGGLYGARQRRSGQVRAQADVPARRGWHRLLLVGAGRRRGERYRPGGGAEGERRVQHRR
jgi:nucleoside-diphosphate-sugar epimerase